MQKYHVCIIGSGPSGERCAIECGTNGFKTLVVDKRERKVGGVSLHVGTIPSKTLREVILDITGFGLSFYLQKKKPEPKELTLENLYKKVGAIINCEQDVLEARFRSKNIDVLYGEARFVDKNTVEIFNSERNTTYTIKADKFVVATGTEPRRPLDVPFDWEFVYDSDFIFSPKNKREKLPESMIVVGAGVIGMEYALMFSALGVNVSIVDRKNTIFPYIDNEINRYLLDIMMSMNINLYFNRNYKEIGVKEGKAYVVTTKEDKIEADCVLFAQGRVPSTKNLNLEKTGVKTDQRGYILTNEHYQTDNPNIFACGDVIGYPSLASTSYEQGRVAARALMGLPIHSHNPHLFPFAIYTIPEIASVGKTEDELIKENIPYEKGIGYYHDVSKAIIKGRRNGMLKILFNRETWEILGVHVIGDQAAEIVHIGQVALEMGAKIDYFLNTVFNYPTWAEIYRIAAFNGINKLTCDLPEN
ncbi:NAD(P) transhydrogenase [Thermotomaculum hydrothermale]|uniref:Soluble pyridine nucleotide transhydrogenase n=1 Tax=Thermotomaculum hydrothermale TaxID=981385 RepID=A0A7R6PZ22_9BACT|nr:Si-specific NAD(P)(+) transhydrogenase [Thermotomaculum hydrothermale]BBB33515.1 NAD(P) transhydrogenase [Thermotomaculum hydrothermale]